MIKLIPASQALDLNLIQLGCISNKKFGDHKFFPLGLHENITDVIYFSLRFVMIRTSHDTLPKEYFVNKAINRKNIAARNHMPVKVDHF